MRKLLFLFFILPSFGFTQTFFGPHINVGYNSGFHGDVGLDLSFINTGESSFSEMFKNYKALQNFIGFEYNNIEDISIYGPKHRIAGHFRFIEVGLNTSLLRSSNNSDWQLILRPEIGFSILTIFSINYNYNLNKSNILYPDTYSPHGITLGVTFPLHDGNGWKWE